jgi:hypothetical protein
MKGLLTILGCCCATWLLAQASLTGKEILRKTVAANGGDTWQQPKTLLLSGNATWTPFGRTDTASIYFDKYEMYRVFPNNNDAARVANGKVRFDARYGDSLYMQLIFDGQSTRNYLSDRAKPFQKYFSWSNNFGFSIIRFADRDSFTVNRLTNDHIDGHACYVVQIIDPKKFVTSFWIDSAHFYIRSVGFVTDLGWHQRIYNQFEKLPVGRDHFFMQPRSLKLYFDGIKWMDIRWLRNRVNNRFKSQTFTI